MATPARNRFSAWLGTVWVKKQDLRYGKSFHQAATLYTYPPEPEGIVQAKLLHDKPVSYNSYTDGEAVYRAAGDFTEPCVTIIKHVNPCRITVGSDIAETHRRAHTCDPVSTFGGVTVANRPVTAELTEQIKDIFAEVIIAPGLDPKVLTILTTKENLRLLKAVPYTHRGRVLHPISGGALLRRLDRIDTPDSNPANWELKADEAINDATLVDLVFAWWAYRAVKSNAILLAHDGASIGVSTGQVNRVDSCRLAVERAGERAAGSVATSGAFFSFANGPRIPIDGSIRAIVQPGGPLRDQETIDLYAEHGVTLYFTGTRHFFH